jgi:hypothetical protein
MAIASIMLSLDPRQLTRIPNMTIMIDIDPQLEAQLRKKADPTTG